MPLESGAKPGSPGFGRNVAVEEKAGKLEKQAVAIAYSKSRDDLSDASVFGSFDATRDGDDPDIAPAVAETEVHALNRRVERPISDNPMADFRNPTPDSARPVQVGVSLRDQNRINREYWRR